MMRSRTSSPLLALLSLIAACTGVLGDPAGPGGARGGSPAGQDGDGDGSGGDDEPAGLGTQILELCEDTSKEEPGPRLLRLLTRREYRNTVRDLLHVTEPDISTLPVEPRVIGFDNNAEASAVTSRHIDEYYSLGEKLAGEAVQNHRSELLPCDPNASGCERTFVERFGLRAFRRPLSSEEMDRYTALFANDLTQGDFDEGMRLVITGMLISPNFLYRSEAGDTTPEGVFKLNQYEIASALSYLFWGSMPDATLLEAAAAGGLDTPEELEGIAREMLNDERARDQLAEFSLQWLRSDNILSANKDAAIYPEFSDSLREAMVEEQKRFVTNLVLDGKGTFGDLFLADYVMANGPLADFYGLPAAGSDFTAVSVTKQSERGGLLGLGAVLASHAHANESSPIKRGLFVRDRLLCQQLPSPPANVDTTPPGLDPNLTTRERFAVHTESPSCAGCHQYIDDVGFGFEGFDGVGKKRENENGKPVDESGVVVGLEGLAEDTEAKFSGPRELAALLAESPNAQACLSLQYYRFARGYEERKSDACSLAALQERFEDARLTLEDLLVALPTLKSFVVRKAD